MIKKGEGNVCHDARIVIVKKGSRKDNSKMHYCRIKRLHEGRNNVGRHWGIGSKLDDTIKNTIQKF